MQLALQPVRILSDTVGFSGLNVRCEHLTDIANRLLSELSGSRSRWDVEHKSWTTFFGHFLKMTKLVKFDVMSCAFKGR